MWLAVARLPVNAQFAGADVLVLAAAALVGPLISRREMCLLGNGKNLKKSKYLRKL